ncbi:unnamed protein product, partial [Allacma fusca]
SLISRNLTLIRSISVVDRSSETALSIPIALAFPREYKFYEEFNSIVGNLRDTGHYDKWFKELMDFDTTVGITWLKTVSDSLIYKKISQSSYAASDVKPFSFDNVAMTFFLLIGGLTFTPDIKIKASLEENYFPCTTTSMETFVAWDPNREPFMGTFYRAIQAASIAYNFTYSINLPAGGLNQFPNGTWPGAVGDILYNDKEIILGYAHTLERAEAVDFSSLFGIIQLIYFKPRPRVGIQLWALFYSYTQMVWILTLIVLLLLVIVIAIGLWLSQKKEIPRTGGKNRQSAFVLISHALWILHHVMFEQSQSISGNYKIKFVLVLSLFFCFIIGFGYKTNLISYLTFPSYQKLPSTFEELASEPKYKIGFGDLKGSGMVFLRTSTSGPIVTIAQRMTMEDNRLNCIINVVAETDFICMEFEHVGTSAVNRNLTLRRSISAVDKSSNEAFFIPIALSFPRSYKFYEEFNSILGILRDTGHYPKWVEELTDFEIVTGIEWLSTVRGSSLFQKLSELTHIEEGVKPFTFENVAVNFYLLFSGLLISCLHFLDLENTLLSLFASLHEGSTPYRNTLIGNASLSLPPLSPVNQIKLIQTTQLARVADSVKTTNHYLNYEVPIIFLDLVSFPDEASSDFLLHIGHNNAPYIFIGSHTKLLGLFEHRMVQKLKWKVGVVSELESNENVNKFVWDSNGKTSIKEVGFDIPSNFGLKSQLNAQSFATTIIPVEPFVLPRSGKEPLQGLCINAMRTASKFYNFSMTVNIPPGGLNQLPNGSWPGVVGDVVHNQKDIVLCYGQSYERNQILEFTTLFGFIEVSFVRANPNKVGVKMTALLQLFQIKVWLMLGTVVSLLVPLFYFALLNQSKDRGYTAVITVYSLLLEQNVSLKMNPFTKFVMVLALFLSLIIGTCYRSNLTSYLTLPHYEKVPDTFQDLAAMEDYNISYLSVKGAGLLFLRNSKLATFVSISERMKVTLDKFKCLLDVVTVPKTVCVGWYHVSTGVIARNLTYNQKFPLFSKSQDSALVIPVAAAFPRNYKFYQEFNEIVGRLRDTGHYRKWGDDLVDMQMTKGVRWLGAHKDSDLSVRLASLSEVETAVKPFRFDNVALGFFLLFVGVVMSAVLFFRETFLHLCTQSGWAQNRIVGSPTSDLGQEFALLVRKVQYCLMWKQDYMQNVQTQTWNQGI